MPTPANLLPTATTGTYGETVAAVYSGNTPSASDPFDQLMSQAINTTNEADQNQPPPPPPTQAPTVQSFDDSNDPDYYRLFSGSTKKVSSSSSSAKSATTEKTSTVPDMASSTPADQIMTMPLDNAVLQSIIAMTMSTSQDGKSATETHGTGKGSSDTTATGATGKIGQGNGFFGRAAGAGVNAKSLAKIAAAEKSSTPSTAPPTPANKTMAITETALTEKLLLSQTGKPTSVLESGLSPDLLEKGVKSTGKSVSLDKISALPGASTAATETDSASLNSLLANAGHGGTKNGSNSSDSPSSDLFDNAKAAAITDGTPAAKQEVAMKSADKTNKIASVSGKNLPVNATVIPRENNLPVRETTAAMAASYSQSVTGVSSAAQVQSVAAIPSAANAQIQTLERTQTLMAVHSLRLASSGTDSLQVVIRPDSGTQLSLDLRQRGDTIEVQATLQQGDFAGLDKNWAELQRNLEQRGIQLAPLAEENNFSTGSHGDFQQSSSYSPADMESAEAGAPVALMTAAATATTSAQPATAHGWESWA